MLNKHYVPGYAGFVPGMKSENPFAKTTQSLAKENIKTFTEKRFAFDPSFTTRAAPSKQLE